MTHQRCWTTRTVLSCCLVLTMWISAQSQDRFEVTPVSASRDRFGFADGNNWQGNAWLGGKPSSQWTLGVRGDSTETGFVISQVTPGGAAERARIQTRDVIIAVEGYQVGLVGGRLYDLNEEINCRADNAGAVRLLLQDGQSGRLASVRVQMENGYANSQQLTGTLIAPQTLPPDAIVTVQVENLTRPQWTVRNGQQVFSAPNQRSIPFQIAYDPQYISPDDIYQVRAFVSSGGRNILFTPQSVLVLTQGNPSQVQVRLENVASTPAYAGPGSSLGGSGGVQSGFANYNQIDDEVTRLYRLYLGRAPNMAELAAAHVLGSDWYTLSQQLPLKLMASQEYFDLARNSNDYWLNNVFGVIVGRQPSQAEMSQWTQRFAQLGYSRTELLRQLDQQTK